MKLEWLILERLVSSRQAAESGLEGDLVIDVHSHLYPRRYIEQLKLRSQIPSVVGEPGGERFLIFHEESAAGGRPMDRTYWELEAKLAFMDAHGIDRAVLSLGNPWLDPVPPAESVALARSLNLEFAALDGESRGRLVGLGVRRPRQTDGRERSAALRRASRPVMSNSVRQREQRRWER